MKELRLVLLGLAAIIAVTLGASFLARAMRRPASHSAEVAAGTDQLAPVAPPPTANDPARARIESLIATSPDYTRFFDRLRLLFPGEYASIVNGLATANKGGEDIDTLMADAVAALRRARGALASKATDISLKQIFAFQLQEMQALEQRDPHLCVAFLYGANGSGFLTFAAEHRALVADAAIAGLDAMNSGRTDQVSRGAPSDTDFQALDHALVDKGLSRPAIDALLDGKTADPPISDPDMCRAGTTYLRTLAELPAESRDRLYGLAIDLMAKT